jgi:translation initiation factor IF-3
LEYKEDKGDERNDTSTSVKKEYEPSAEVHLKIGGKDIDIQIDKHDTTWNYENIEEWLDQRNKIKEMDINSSVRNLDHFCYFYAKTLHKICTCLTYHTDIPVEIFKIRHLFVKKITDVHIEYVNAHV